MNSYEMAIIREVVNRHLTRYEKPAVPNFRVFFEKWQGRDFTPTFEEVMGEVLNDNRKKALELKYKRGASLTMISQQMDISVGRASQICNEALRKLTDPDVLTKLYMGKDAYQKMLDEQALSANRESTEKEKDPLVKSLGLSNRTFNCLARYMHFAYGINATELRISDVLAKVSSLDEVLSCGVSTQYEIICVFKENGVDTRSWERAYENRFSESRREKEMRSRTMSETNGREKNDRL